ncbi:MAG: bifunctional nuclease family protein [Corynebacteriales bacterium]|nr:bifunctional nuclease family protein [Mycobacteriales bacterium]
MKTLNVVGVRVELPTNQPIVLLKETDGERYLPIWIGSAEATAIALICDPPDQLPSRPLTHDLLKDVLEHLSVEVEGVEITELRENVFYAELILGQGARISARPSDAIALAIRVGAPITCAEAVLDEAGIVIPEDDNEEQEEEVEKFREFLDQISPEDFMGPSSTS